MTRMDPILPRTPREIGVYSQMDPRQKPSGIPGGQLTQLFDRLPLLLVPYLIPSWLAYLRQPQLAKNKPGQNRTTSNSKMPFTTCPLLVIVGDVGSIAL